MDIRNLGNFPSLAAVWQAYPSGGLEGDYLYVPNTSGVKYSWNKFARTWGNEDDPGTPSRQGNSVSDLNVQNELNVGSAADFHSDVHIRGKLYAEHVKQPNVGMFATLAALQAAYPHPEVGMWATVGDSMPGAVYRCDTAGTWTATGGTGGVDEIDNVLMYSAQELTSSQKKQAQQNIGVTLCNVAEVNDFVVDIVLKEGADNPESENYVDISNATAIVIQCSYINQNTNKYTNSLQIYTGNEWVNLFYKSYDTLEEAKDDFGKLLENQKCLVVIRGDGSYRTTIYSPLVFGRDISWKSLNEHPVIKELLIEQQTSKEITESHNELIGRIAVMDRKIGFFNWEKDKLFRTTTSDDTQLAVIGEPYTLTEMSWPNSKYAIIDVVPGDQIYVNSKGINDRTATYLILGTNDVVIDYNKDGDNNISGGAVDAIITMPSGAKKLLVNAFNGAYGASYPGSVEGQLEEITESYNELSGRIDNVLMYSAQELTSSQKKQAQQNIGVTLCNVAEVNDFVVDIVLKEGADNPESENYVDISNATAIVIQCSYINQNTNKYTNSLQIYTGNEWVNLFYKSYDTLEEAKDDFGKLLENQKCLVVIRGDGSYRTTIYSPLVFGRDISWKSLNEHPVIKELLIEQQTSKEITESHNELIGRIAVMDRKIGFFNWEKDKLFRTTTSDDTQLAVIGEPYTLTEMSWPNSKYAIIDVVPGDQIYVNSKGINDRTATYLILGTNDVVIDYNKDGDNNISGGAVDSIITMPSGAKKLLVNAANGAYGASYPESVEDQLKKITFSDGVYKIPKVFDSTANSFLSSNALQDISVVAVHNQNDFDNINATVLELLNHGSKGVKVEIDAGTYLAKDIIDFSNINTECSISFAGKGVNIICSDTILLSSNKVGFTNTHDIYTHVFDTGDIYIGDDFSEIKLSNLESKFGFWPKAASQVEKSSVFGGETECRLLLPDDCQFLTYTQGMTIALTSWYLCVNGNVLGIHDGYIHFNVPDAAYIDFDNKVNGDFSRYSSYPRFNVSNIGCDDSYAFAYDGKLYIPNRYKKIYCCNKSGFVRVSNNPNMSVCISGLNFVGSKLNQSNHADNSVITIADVKSSYIINNTFAYNGNTCIANKSTLGTTGTKHIVSHNIATNLKNRFSYIRCDDVTFEYNEIRDTGQIYLCGATKFHGARFYIGHNSVLNSPYHCLSVGISKESVNEISGVVEYNHCYNEREYIAKNKTLSDFGIVSFYLYNTDIICRNNVIHGAYSCCGEARGIFGDDGCNNVKITGNLVWGCKTFCIDFRYVSTEMSTSGSGNEMGNNVCVGKLRFQGSPTDSPAYIKPKLGSNYYTDAIFSSNVEREGEDFLIQAKVHEHFVECLNNLPDLTPFIASYIQ